MRRGAEASAAKRDESSVERDVGRGSGPVNVIFCWGGAGMDAAEVEDSASESESESDTGAGALAAEAEWSPKKLREAGRAVDEEDALAFPFPVLLVFSFF